VDPVALELFCERCGTTAEASPDDLIDLDCRCYLCDGTLVLQVPSDGRALDPEQELDLYDRPSTTRADTRALFEDRDALRRELGLGPAPEPGQGAGGPVEPEAASAAEWEGDLDGADDLDDVADDPYARAAEALDRGVTAAVKRRTLAHVRQAPAPESARLGEVLAPPASGDEAEAGAGALRGAVAEPLATAEPPAPPAPLATAEPSGPPAPLATAEPSGPPAPLATAEPSGPPATAEPPEAEPGALAGELAAAQEAITTRAERLDEPLPDGAEAAAPPSVPEGALPGARPAAPPIPAWDGGDTHLVEALARSEPDLPAAVPFDQTAAAADPAAAPEPEATDLDELVEVVQVPAGTSGRGSRTYERDDYDRVSEAATPVFGEPAAAGDVVARALGPRDVDWLALIDEELPELEAPDDAASRVFIRLPEDAAPKAEADPEQAARFTETMKNLEAGGPDSLDGLLSKELSDSRRVAQRFEAAGAEPAPEEEEEEEEEEAVLAEAVPPTPDDAGPEGAAVAAEPGDEAEDDTSDWGPDERDEGNERTQDLSGTDAVGAEAGARPSGRVIEEFHHAQLDPALICARHTDSPQADYFRQLYQRIFHSGNGDAPRTILVTSPSPGAGKTTIAANLAVVAARIPGRGAVLVDADPRGRGGVMRLFGVRVRSEGLLEALQTGGDPTEYVVQFNLNELDVVPLGVPGSDAPELIASDRMARLLARLEAAYPYAVIIVDGSSILHSADPFVLARNVDGVVVVVRAGLTPREDLRRSFGMLGSSRVLGVVLNDARVT